ncbi:MAG: type II toxin-antitoxin system HicB family antitoxin [Chlorogloeopsis fritschii C42_A2020_084]|uniref:type II toxin-antitoxin system HicB family antitoxin n=1 Tax=Chlorogloeopsis fritschii TaxID=1124 RepID=UPI001A0E8ED8|nr:type II toxin-antitoxin system HicB family antitoxin [Chlorogloeopsis fritschii]MBF2006385.1 type II toxin-antitoxin system HicB family antitoxin [Chlorogloeopsis fritschii C42_A2020_084]
MINSSQREFYVIIERDEDGYYVGEVPQLKAYYSQGETIDELMQNIKEVVELCLEETSDEIKEKPNFLISG